MKSLVESLEEASEAAQELGREFVRLLRLEEIVQWLNSLLTRWK